MKNAGRAVMAALLGCLATQAHPADTSDVPRVGLITVGNKDIYMPIPSAYPMAAAGQRIGPDKLWYKAFWVPTGETLASWSEMTSILMLPGNAEPLEVMAAQMSNGCPKSFFKKLAEAPQLINMHGTVSAATMGCTMPSDRSRIEIGGYYLSIRTTEYSYLLSTEFRGDRIDAKERLSNAKLSDTVKTFARFAACEKNDMCFKSAK